MTLKSLVKSGKRYLQKTILFFYVMIGPGVDVMMMSATAVRSRSSWEERERVIDVRFESRRRESSVLTRGVRRVFLRRVELGMAGVDFRSRGEGPYIGGVDVDGG